MNYKQISSKNNQLIIDVNKLKNRKARDNSSLFFFEGTKLFKEAISANIDFEYVFATKNNLDIVISTIGQKSDTTVIEVTDEIYKKITEEQSPEGIFCVAKFLNNISKINNICYNANKKYVFLIDLQDPGNVGTIIRTACSFDIDGVIISENTANVYSSKVIRASMGAVFKEKIFLSENTFDTVIKLNENGINTYAATLDKDSVKLGSVSFHSGCCLLIGNEGNGIPKDISDLCTKKIIIPISNNTESLNASAASSILIWEMSKSK